MFAASPLLRSRLSQLAKRDDARMQMSVATRLEKIRCLRDSRRVLRVSGESQALWFPHHRASARRCGSLKISHTLGHIHLFARASSTARALSMVRCAPAGPGAGSFSSEDHGSDGSSSGRPRPIVELSTVRAAADTTCQLGGLVAGPRSLDLRARAPSPPPQSPGDSCCALASACAQRTQADRRRRWRRGC